MGVGGGGPEGEQKEKNRVAAAADGKDEGAKKQSRILETRISKPSL